MYANRLVTISAVLLAFAAAASAQDLETKASTIRSLDSAVFSPKSDEAKQLAEAVGAYLLGNRAVVNRRATAAWRGIKGLADWEKYRDPRIQALKDSLGIFPEPPKDLKVRVTGTNKGEGFIVDNLVYESRPGLLVTANQYRPASPGKDMPGILIIASHHNPKTQSELQDMGMTWARLGCVVLVPDQLGHGERRQHPFIDDKSYAGSFKPGRQDYYFRYNVGMQLHLIGDSQIGWMVWDMMRGVDLLLSRPDIDSKRIILFGSVAGGGDPAAVTAAIDPRIAAVAPFNFGGPQPESRYPISKDAEESFNYAGGGGWESTRNLRLSWRDGFLPWVIVGATAPRGLIYAHEFAWDKDNDPVWKRLQTIFQLYNTGDRLSSTHGSGSVKGSGPGNTHCNNIGPIHRKPMYPAFKQWFGMPIPEAEYQTRFTSKELQCLTVAIKPTPVHQLASQIADERMNAARAELQQLPAKERRQRLAEKWSKLLGSVTADVRKPMFRQTEEKGDIIAERFALVDVVDEKLEPAVAEPSIPVLLLLPKNAPQRVPVVVALAQHGKQAFLQQRAQEIAALLDKGVAVCLPDVRGTGEGRTSESRGRQTADTSYSSSALMMGDTMLGARVRDVRSVFAALRNHPKIDAKKLAIWGDSFAKVNPPERNLTVPLDAEALPDQSEPLGGLLALFTALHEPDVQAVCVRGGLVGFDSVLESQFCWLPHDVIVPGALTAGDLCDVAAALAPRAVRIENAVNGLNRAVAKDELAKAYESARTAYRQLGVETQLELSPSTASVAEWLAARIR